MKPVVGTSLNLLSVVLPSASLWIIIRQYFSSYISDGTSSLLSTFCAAIVVFSARFGATFCCFKFYFCWRTYVRPLSHLSLLGFVTFVFFTLCCQLFFILPCHLFFFINPSVLSYYLSFLLPDEACERSVLNSNVCCPSVCCSSLCCSLNYHTSILFVIHKYRNFCSVAHFRAANVVFFAGLGAAFCC